MKIIDISQVIYQGMPVYPGDPTFQSHRVNSFLHPGDHGVGQRLLQGRALQQDGRLCGGKDAVRRQRGQVQIRLHAICRRERQKRFVLHRDERAFQCKSV